MIKTKQMLQNEAQGLRKDIKFFRRQGLTATVNHLAEQLQAVEARLQEMRRVYNPAIAQIRTRNGDAFRSGKWEDLH